MVDDLERRVVPQQQLEVHLDLGSALVLIVSIDGRSTCVTGNSVPGSCSVVRSSLVAHYASVA